MKKFSFLFHILTKTWRKAQDFFVLKSQYFLRLKDYQLRCKNIKGDFACDNCHSLKSLEGAPKEVGGDFRCSYCDSLKSLKGAPKEVGGNFWVYSSNEDFSFVENDIKKATKVRGKIIC